MARSGSRPASRSLHSATAVREYLCCHCRFARASAAYVAIQKSRSCASPRWQIYTRRYSSSHDFNFRGRIHRFPSYGRPAFTYWVRTATSGREARPTQRDTSRDSLLLISRTASFASTGSSRALLSFCSNLSEYEAQ